MQSGSMPTRIHQGVVALDARKTCQDQSTTKQAESTASERRFTPWWAQRDYRCALELATFRVARVDSKRTTSLVTNLRSAELTGRE